MRRLASILLLALVPLFVTACGDDSPTGPAEVSIEGTWTGSIEGGTFTLTLAQQGSDITGSGNISATGGSASLNITGTRSGANISLVMTSSGFEDLNYSGTIQNATTINGTLNGSGFQNEPLTLTK